MKQFRTCSQWLAASALLLLVPRESNAGVIHRWSFSDGSGTNIADSVGSATGHVTPGTNTDFFWTNGALHLNGGTRTTASYVQFPAGLLHSGGITSNVTIEIWANPLSFQNWARVFDFGPGNNTQANNFFLAFSRGTASGTQRYEFGAPAIWTLDTGAATAAGNQYHYVAVWGATGGPNGGGLAQWYRNGVLIGSMDTGTNTIASVNDTVLWLGRSQYTADSTANAEYDEVRMYDFVLNQTQINTNFANGPNTLVLLPPIANNDSMTLNPGAKALINVLANDVGQSGNLNPATIAIVTPPSAGTALVKSNGILYTHNGGPATNDSFTYTVKDTGNLTSAPATVSITVNPALRLPNTTITVPNTAPATTYQVVDAFPGLTINQALALRTPTGNVGTNNTNLLFITERRGYVSYIDTSLTNPVRQVMLNISNQIQFDASTTDGEMGLESMEFHPNFASNGIFFVTYVAPGGNPYVERLARFTANPTTLAVDTNSQVILWQITKREFNHCGADLHFGNDGYLYVSMGDEGGQYNVHTNAQRLDLGLYAGILRLDVDKNPANREPLPPSTGNTVVLTIPTYGTNISVVGPGGPGTAAYYSIPADNPFWGVQTNADAIAVDTNHLRGEYYVIGMRHPWRFSIDKPTGDIWVGVVGQDLYEGVYKIQKGSNYGWPYYEANHVAYLLYPTNSHPGIRVPPTNAFFTWTPPLYEYPHNSVAGADPAFAGLDVNGSLVYHGSRFPALNNVYLFGDFDTGGNIWALHVTNNTATAERLAGMPGLSSFGADPRNGDVLMCNYLQNKIQRLVFGDALNTGFPQKLSDTGIFADLATLTPNPGIVSYQPNITFWSDYAVKTRWFTIPDLTNTVGFSQDGTWTLPTGMKWIKHFDLQLDRTNAATKRRIETRVLVKTDTGVYGVSYEWTNTQDEAYLVPDSGDTFNLTVTNNGVPEQQTWEIPSRSSCLACHTQVGGNALTFNTREMNKNNPMNGVAGNQIATMSAAGYFSAPVPSPNALPAFAVATDTNFSLEYRVRSYLSVNCVQCHQPGGAGPGWDARAFLTLAQTGLLTGIPIFNGGDTNNRYIVPGDTNHSVLLLHLENTNGFSRMPPLATHELDFGSISLVQNWITTELPGHLTYQQWIALYPSLSGPSADPNADPDGDGANNFFEYLTGTDPTSAASKWNLSITTGGGQVSVSYPQVPNVGVVVDTSADLMNWTPWDVTGNQPVFALVAGTRTVSGPITNSPPFQFFRARIIEP